jgi:hypothetical protein
MATAWWPHHTPHSTQHTAHSTFHTPHTTHHTPHTTHHTAHSTHHTPHTTHHTPHITHHTPHTTHHTCALRRTPGDEIVGTASREARSLYPAFQVAQSVVGTSYPKLTMRVPCRAVPCRAVPCRAVPCRAVPSALPVAAVAVLVLRLGALLRANIIAHVLLLVAFW